MRELNDVGKIEVIVMILHELYFFDILFLHHFPKDGLALEYAHFRAFLEEFAGLRVGC